MRTRITLLKKDCRELASTSRIVYVPIGDAMRALKMHIQRNTERHTETSRNEVSAKLRNYSKLIKK